MRRLISLALASALGACSLAPVYERPALPAAPSWPLGDAYLVRDEAALPTVTYAEIFTDPRLQTLIGEALANNRDLRVGYANLAAARAQVRVVRARQLPELDADASASYRAQSGGDSESYSVAGGVAGYELDLFGKLANATEAQRDLALASEANARTVRLGIIANLASAWLSYAADRDLLKIARDTVADAQRSYDLIDLRLKGGIAPRSDLRQAEQVLATAQGDVAAQTAALAQDENLVRLLLGTPSVDQALLPGGLSEALPTVRALPAGTSSQVLLRRPDVIEAEYRLRAANADIGVARAQLFPSISLTGLLGVASNALGSLFTSGAFSATATAGASAPIFDFGGRQANVEVSKAQRDAAVASYEGAIQQAFREVADALATQGTIADRLAAARRYTTAAADTARLVDLRYSEGIDSSLARLDAQRSLYTARRAQIGVELAAVLNRVDLYRAIGGDTAAATEASGTDNLPGR